MNFLTHVTEVLQKVNRNDSLVEQLHFIFTKLPGCSRKSAYELDDSEITAYATFLTFYQKKRKRLNPLHLQGKEDERYKSAAISKRAL